MIILRGILLTSIPYKPGNPVMLRENTGKDTVLQLTKDQAEQVTGLLDGRVSACGEWLDQDPTQVYVASFRVISIVREP